MSCFVLVCHIDYIQYTLCVSVPLPIQCLHTLSGSHHRFLVEVQLKPEPQNQNIHVCVCENQQQVRMYLVNFQFKTNKHSLKNELEIQGHLILYYKNKYYSTNINQSCTSFLPLYVAWYGSCWFKVLAPVHWDSTTSHEHHNQQISFISDLHGSTHLVMDQWE